jgi:small subunit ribosomal protein S16
LAVRIRLMRMGSKGRPFYRIVVAHAASKRGGRAIEQIGFYDPLTDPATVKVDADKALLWLQRGAQPTETTADLLRKEGVMDRFQASKSSKAPAAGAEAPAVVAPEAEAPAARKPAKRTKAPAGSAAGSKG